MPTKPPEEMTPEELMLEWGREWMRGSGIQVFYGNEILARLKERDAAKMECERIKPLTYGTSEQYPAYDAVCSVLSAMQSAREAKED